ncbi:MAG TPA: colanic acid biosynthesis glycosyltransferase WcaI, partial [Gammaproteobacteria bacterium]|nr:colanic acid biosynthesis glycosyltransferase WcaI [Gammaproteobacteria bacterium]
LLDAAAAMAHNRKIKFFIVGSGAHKEVLENQSRSRGLDNVYFKPLLPWESVPTMLAAADVHLVIQRKGAADAVLPSKLTNILSAGGHAVVTAEPHTELGRIAAKHPGIFSCVDPENLDGFLHGLESELAAASRNGVNPIARRYAETNLNQDAILTRFRSDLELLVGGSIRTTSENG